MEPNDLQEFDNLSQIAFDPQNPKVLLKSVQ